MGKIFPNTKIFLKKKKEKAEKKPETDIKIFLRKKKRQYHRV